MKKIKISSEQFDELQRQQQIRDLSYKISSDLVYLSSICKRKDKKGLFDSIKALDDLKENAIKEIKNMIEWSNGEE